MDDESEAVSPTADVSDSGSEDEQRQKSRFKIVPFTNAGKASFSCMSKNDGVKKAENPNAHTINTLQHMADVYTRLQDTWRPLAYRRAISQLKKQPKKIVTKEQAEQLPFIGERLALKIQEIATTNRLRRLENALIEPEEKSLQIFLGIYGVGVSQAHKWIENGLCTVQDLISSKAPLNKGQLIGIEHYDEFNARIPRSEMTCHDNFVRRFTSILDPSLQFTIGGSYRRGAETSGDIDFIVTKPETSSSTIKKIMLDLIIPSFEKAGYLKAGLATASHRHSNSGSKWHGACALPLSKADREAAKPDMPWRRIDFLFVPWNEIGAALLYFTGNDTFNRSIRLLASKKGMRLNQRGLYKDVLRGPKSQKITEGTLVEGHDERKIFDALGVPWREPWERIC